MNQNLIQQDAKKAGKMSGKIKMSKKLLNERPHLPDTDKFGMDKEPSRFNDAGETPEPKSWRSSGDDL